MISVTSLTTYMFCARKLYLQKILEFEEPPKDIVIQGSIKHSVFDKINKLDEPIVTSILKPTDELEIQSLYRQKYSEILRQEIKKNREILNKLNLSSSQLFTDTWPLFLSEAIVKAKDLSEFIKEYKLFGEELWKALTPKVMTEIKLFSRDLELIGIVDRIEVRNKKYIPIELKTGRPPKQNVWPEHKIQIAAYAMLIEKNFNKDVTHGFVHYVGSKEKRLVYINPFLKNEIQKITTEVKELLESNKMPPILENKAKCKNCGLREECYKLK